ncbi:MAG: transporter [Gemmatimonadota bacterium]|nr:MAG: transporter [Gemmatimonadota bacterium]
MKKLILGICIAQLFLSSHVDAAGISVDAGLTPPEDRWILRTQMRFMQRKDHMNQKMKMYHYPVILAYGLRSNTTLMIRQALVQQKMTMALSEFSDWGFGDLFILGKYKLYRRNTESYTFGMSATLGLEFPTGNDPFTSSTWDATGGFYTSYRRGAWALDANVAYVWNGLMRKHNDTRDPGDELSFDWAIAHQISMGDHARAALAPVLELSYKNYASDDAHGSDVPNTGESIFFLAPGLKCTLSSIILEGLLWVPLWQDQIGTQMEREVGFLIGTRYMF